MDLPSISSLPFARQYGHERSSCPSFLTAKCSAVNKKDNASRSSRDAVWTDDLAVVFSFRETEWRISSVCGEGASVHFVEFGQGLLMIGVSRVGCQMGQVETSLTAASTLPAMRAMVSRVEKSMSDCFADLEI